MNSRRPLAASVGVVLALSMLTAGCKTTILKTMATDTVVPSSTTTTLPTGDIPTLLGDLQKTAEGLTTLVANGDSAGAKARLAEANNIWTVLKPKIIASKIDLVDDVQRIVDLFSTAVNRRRPADADKALRFVPLVIDAYNAIVK